LSRKLKVLVNKAQRGNPILANCKFQYEISDEASVEDFLIPGTVSIAFLSLRFHDAYPDCVSTKLSDLYKQ
jgi:hypothetical protein